MHFFIRKKYQPEKRNISLNDIEVHKVQSLDSANYYTQNCVVISNHYIRNIHVMFMGKPGELVNEVHERFLRLICYAFDKVAPRVKDFSKKVGEIKIYLEEDSGFTEIRWPKIEDKEFYQSIKWPETGPCLHINRKNIERENVLNNKSMRRMWPRKSSDNRTSVGKNGPLGVADIMYEKNKSLHKYSLDSVLSVKVVASLVHEIGHILHAQCDKSEVNIFWESKRSNAINSPSEIRRKHTIHADIAQQVSSYV